MTTWGSNTKGHTNLPLMVSWTISPILYCWKLEALKRRNAAESRGKKGDCRLGAGEIWSWFILQSFGETATLGKILGYAII